MRGIVTAMGVASDEDGEGSKAMEMVTRVVGKQRRRGQRGQWQWQQGWQARMQGMVRHCKQEGNGWTNLQNKIKILHQHPQPTPCEDKTVRGWLLIP